MSTATCESLKAQIASESPRFTRALRLKTVGRTDVQAVISSCSRSGPVKVMAVLLVTSNKSRRLLCISYIGRMQPEEFQRNHEQLTAQLGEMSPGFCLLVDFSHLEFMGLDCEPELGGMMELIGRAGVGWVARVIPDSNKDIGMNILTAFHYPHRLRVVTCKSLVEAARAIGL